MAQSTLSNDHADFTIKHRAICEDDNFKGSWRDTIDAAKADAANHRSQPGNTNHVIKIITQQTLSMSYIG